MICTTNRHVFQWGAGSAYPGDPPAGLRCICGRFTAAGSANPESTKSADLERRLGALVAAGNAMAEEIGHLLAGGIEMQPAEDGPVTFEAMLMMLQMLGVYRGQWRALAEAGEGSGSINEGDRS